MPRRDAGFTLIEILVVLAIVGLAGVTATWSMKLIRDRNLVLRTITSFKVLSEAARAQAIDRGTTIALSIDTAHRALIVVALNRTERLSSEVALNWLSASVSQRGGSEASILFLPDGTSTGGRLLVKAGDAIGAVRISWISGLAVDEP